MCARLGRHVWPPKPCRSGEYTKPCGQRAGSPMETRLDEQSGAPYHPPVGPTGVKALPNASLRSAPMRHAIGFYAIRDMPPSCKRHAPLRQAICNLALQREAFLQQNNHTSLHRCFLRSRAVWTRSDSPTSRSHHGRKSRSASMRASTDMCRFSGNLVPA